jgi:hypothetical protein
MARHNLLDWNDFLWAGAHRGANTVAPQLKSSTFNREAPTVLIADPKENRAEVFGEVLKKQFPALRTLPLVMTAQDALLERGGRDAVVTLDTMGDTIATLNAVPPSRHATFQIVGRGPATGTRIGLQGTITPGDHETQESVALLLPALAQMSRAASSRELTGPDKVTAVVLEPFRRIVGARTARHLGEKGRDPRDLTGSPLSMTFGQSLLPLITVPGRAQDKFSQQQALAMHTAGVLAGSNRTQPGRMVVVAIVIAQQAVHFMRVAITGGGRRVIAGVCSFVRPVERAASSTAVFTD